MIIDLLFLPVLLLIGVITSYEDFRDGKIRNKWIKAGLLWGVFGYLALFLWFKLSFLLPTAISATSFLFIFPTSFFVSIITNSLISFAVGYLLWHFGIWAAGDAKLFFVFSLLLPLGYYANGSFPYFPSLALLLNVFILAFAFLVLRSLYDFSKELDISSLKLKGDAGIFNYSLKYIKDNYLTIVKTIIIFFSVLFIFQVIRFEIRLAMGLSENNKDVNGWLLFIFLIISRFFSYFRRLIKNIWPLVLVYLVAIPFLWFRGFFDSSQNVEQIFSLMKNSLLFSLFFSPIIILLVHMQKKKEGKSMPFAIWLFAGVIVTMIFRGSMFLLFSQLAR